MKYLIALFVVFISSVTVAQDYHRGQMTPTTSEKLPQAVFLEGICDDVLIVEWRATEGDARDTGPNIQSLKNIKTICEIAVNNFIPFLRKHHSTYYFTGDLEDFDVRLCLMPDNKKPRNLNDTDYRFVHRSTKDEVWGYHHRAVNHIYITNEVLQNGEENPIFNMVLAHEIFHALSFNYKIYDQHMGNKDSVEESLAREFTTYLGIDAY